MSHTQPPLTAQASRPESTSVHLRGPRTLGDRVVVATWPSTSGAGLSACLRDKSRFPRSMHSSWVHSPLGSGHFLGLWGTLDLDASWASGWDTGSGRFLGLWVGGTIWTLPGPLGGTLDLDASWASGEHWCFEGAQAGGSACPSRGLSVTRLRPRATQALGPCLAQRPRRPRGSGGVVGRVGLLLEGGFLRTPAPGHLGSGQGPDPIKAWAQTR